jgi:Sporulation and spore germination
MTIMSRNLKITLGILAVAVAIGLISLGGLRGRIQRLAQSQKSEEQARREVLALPISTPTDVLVTARIFWAAGADKTAPTELPLPLSADPVQRSKQVLQALVTNPPTPDQRTIPAEVELLGLYILPDGTAIADFSDALASKTPSGILSERLAVDSIARTVENNVPGLHRLKILIHGQEVDTLAGHVDLTGFFDLNPPPQQPLPPAGGSAPLSPGSAATPLPPVPAMPPERPSN